jgi:hypothetical protein
MCCTWIVLLFLAALLVTGCGGGGGDASSAATTGASGTALTKAELIERGDAICAKVYPTRDSLNPEGTPEEALRVAKLISGMTKQLLVLGIPQETEYAYAEYATALHVLDRMSAKVQKMVKRGKPGALRSAETGSLSSLSGFEGYAGAYGFKACAEG